MALETRVKERPKGIGGLRWLVSVVYTLVVFFILLNNVLFSGKDYPCKKTFLLQDGWILLLCVIILSIVIFGYSRRKALTKGKFSIGVASGILFVIQIFICYHICFVTETWDVSWIIKDAENLALGNLTELNLQYYSSYPNNRMILLLYAGVFRVAYTLGMTYIKQRLMVIIVIQCAMSSVTGYLVYHIVQEETESHRVSLLSWLLFVLLLGLSPWNVITYTDMLALLFPTLILRIYQTLKNGNYVLLKWLAVILLSVAGYLAKPTVAILLIAILLGEILYSCGEGSKATYVAKIGILLVLTGVAFFGGNRFLNVVAERCGLVIDEEANVGMMHMLMMGLNDENDGVWIAGDVALSTSYDNREERVEAQKEVIKTRLESYGVKGLLRHVARKSLVVFNDGTFAWGEEAGFFDCVFPDENKVISPFLKECFYKDGKYYSVVALIEQMVWFFVLLCSSLCFCRKLSKESWVVSLALIGIVLFNLLFEARARYLLVYVPIFIIAAGIGLYNFTKIIKESIWKLPSKRENKTA